MEEVAFEVRSIMCALTKEYIELQCTYGAVINHITSIYDIQSGVRFELGVDFSNVINRILLLAIGSNITFFDIARLQNIISSRSVDVAGSTYESAAMDLAAAKVHLKTLENLLLSYGEVSNAVHSEMRTLLTNYGTMNGTVEPSKVVLDGVESIMSAIDACVSSDELSGFTEKCHKELYETVVSEYGESIDVKWKVAAQFYGNYISVSAIILKPSPGSIH